MKDRVVGILPALVGQAARSFAQIFDVTVTVAIAPSFDPLDGTFDVGPQLVGELEVSGGLDAASVQPQEKRGRVDAAIVSAEWHFAGRRHLAGSDLVHDLAGLLVACLIDCIALKLRKRPQGSNRDLRIKRKYRQRRDYAVASEERGEPRNARHDERAPRSPRATIEVRSTPACRIMSSEFVIAGRDDGPVAAEFRKLGLPFLERRAEVGAHDSPRRPERRFTAGRDPAFELAVFTRLEAQHEHGALTRQSALERNQRESRSNARRCRDLDSEARPGCRQRRSQNFTAALRGEGRGLRRRRRNRRRRKNRFQFRPLCQGNCVASTDGIARRH